MTAILGISAFYHDSAAALVVDGDIVAAAQEERFTRKKHDPGFPANAIAYCLKEGGLQGRPARLRRLLRQAASPSSTGCWRPTWPTRRRASRVSGWPCRSGSRTSCTCAGRLRQRFPAARRTRWSSPDHHESHAASAFFPSPFERAAILTVDGVGEWSTATFGDGGRQPAAVAAGTAVSAFAGAALFRLHLLLRVQGEQRRIQAHGPGPLRPARLCRTRSSSNWWI